MGSNWSSDTSTGYVGGEQRPCKSIGAGLLTVPSSICTLLFDLKNIKTVIDEDKSVLRYQSWLCWRRTEYYEDKYSWLENYAGSSGLQTQASVVLENGVPVDQLELDCWQSPLLFCPLLADPTNYVPDTVDLNADHEAR
ncbi:Pantothenate kinase 4 [Homalodisca vitripennis]|nr:Pantothenate kinase 4 [Homalodisca vitripennis]